MFHKNIQVSHLLKNWKLWPHRSMPAWAQLAEAPLYHHDCWFAQPIMRVCVEIPGPVSIAALVIPIAANWIYEDHQACPITLASGSITKKRPCGDPMTRPCLPQAPSPHCVSLAPPDLGGPALNLGTLSVTLPQHVLVRSEASRYLLPPPPSPPASLFPGCHVFFSVSPWE